MDEVEKKKVREERSLLAQEAELLQKKIELQEGLPFLHGWPWYPWAKDFFESTNRMNFLCAANQISKSSTQIRKCIHWATEDTLWPSLWVRKPTQFWYLYPSRPVANAEWLTKWSLFMPKGKFKDDPKYGWTVEKDSKGIIAVHFNSGVHLFFKSYGQNAADLQTGTCDAVFCDEELPVNIYDELSARLNATDGYFHMVFTATLGQETWRRTMEPSEEIEELYPDAFKQCVSLYDSQKYICGTPSPWTDEKIERVKAKCSSHAEYLKRVMGRFVLAGGRKYGAFDITKHLKKKHPIPPSWLVFEGVDVGSGGDQEVHGKTTAHKSAICFIAVRPDFRQGRVFMGWRGDNALTTSGDVYEKHIELVKKLSVPPIQKFYDWAAKDFGTIALRAGDAFEKAEKGHDIGEGIINTLFKNDMMAIYDDPELMKLATELSTLNKGTCKTKAKDDFADAFRYGVTKIPWDFNFLSEPSKIIEPVEKPLNNREQEIHDRKERFQSSEEDPYDIEQEFAEWNEAYGA